ncbi:hypothetical protein LguiB_017747 [Lonicera macranthoides]
MVWSFKVWRIECSMNDEKLGFFITNELGKGEDEDKMKSCVYVEFGALFYHGWIIMA